MKEFSTSWKSSTRPNKQRKYRFKAPLHVRGSFMNSHLSKDLRKKYNVRALRVRLGDKVRIMRGQFKRQEGKVEDVNMRDFKIFISKVEHTKRDGTKARYPIDPSNVMIVELNESKRRLDKQNKSAPVKQSKTGKTNAEDNVETKAENKAVRVAEKGGAHKVEQKTAPKSDKTKVSKKSGSEKSATSAAKGTK